jgi:CRP-like cAMP-binding protein
MFVSPDECFTQYPILRYDTNQIIIHADDSPSGVFYIKNGFVKMSAILENGREITLNIFKSGAYFPMIWAIADISNTYYYRTVGKTELKRIPRDKVLEFVKKDPDFLFDLTKRILSGVSGLLLNIEHQLSGDSYHRVIAALVLAVNRFGVVQNKCISINFPMTHQEIAGIAGLTRETVSLAMEKLVKKKIIAYKGRTLLINDKGALMKESTIYEEENQTPNTL